jgi:hypothetical protein
MTSENCLKWNLDWTSSIDYWLSPLSGQQVQEGNQAKVLCERKSCRFLTQEGAIAVCEREIEGEDVIGWYTETQTVRERERERERERAVLTLTFTKSVLSEKTFGVSTPFR